MRGLAASLALLAWSCGGGRVELPRVETAALSAPVREAIEQAAKAAANEPSNAATVARFGMVLHAHQQYAAAAQAYQRASNLDPSNWTILYYWGTVLAADGRIEEALLPLRRAARTHRIPFRLKLADTLYAVGKTEEAAAEYRSLIETDGQLAAAYYGLGRTQRGEDAAKTLRRAVDLFPQYGAARFALAGVYRQLGQKEEAEAALVNYERDKLIVPPMDDPALAEVMALDVSSTGLLRKAQAMERAGNLREAASIHERVVDGDPKLTQAWINLISLYGRLGDAVRAESAYRKAIALAPRNGEAHYNYGVLCAQSNRWPEARTAFESAVAADPHHAEALDNLGAVLERGGEPDKAGELFGKAAAAKPSLRLAQYHLGRYYANRRRYPEAIAALERAITPVDDATPAYIYALGAVHARSGGRAKALAVLEEARRLAIEMRQNDLADSILRDITALRR